MYKCAKIPKTLHILPAQRQIPKFRIAGMDPGTRTFQTLYDNSNKVTFFGYEQPHDIDSFHHAIAKYLTKEYLYVCLPKFNVKSYWNHSAFYDILYSAHSGLIETNEYLTSQICSNCGSINKCNKIYRCKCGLIMDRDTNAAKNILKRGITTLKKF